MPRYIDADVILTKFDKALQLAGNDGAIAALKFCKEIVRKAPTISPDEVRGVGEWRNKVMAVPGGHGQTYSRWGCSVCKKKFKERTNYCPNCGAKMEVSE